MGELFDFEVYNNDIKFQLLGLYKYWPISVFEVIHANPLTLLINAQNIINKLIYLKKFCFKLWLLNFKCGGIKGKK
jgi:hypothetical protein